MLFRKLGNFTASQVGSEAVVYGTLIYGKLAHTRLVILNIHTVCSYNFATTAKCTAKCLWDAVSIASQH